MALTKVQAELLPEVVKEANVGALGGDWIATGVPAYNINFLLNCGNFLLHNGWTTANTTNIRISYDGYRWTSATSPAGLQNWQRGFYDSQNDAILLFTSSYTEGNGVSISYDKGTTWTSYWSPQSPTLGYCAAVYQEKINGEIRALYINPSAKSVSVYSVGDVTLGQPGWTLINSYNYPFVGSTQNIFILQDGVIICKGFSIPTEAIISTDYGVSFQYYNTLPDPALDFGGTWYGGRTYKFGNKWYFPYYNGSNFYDIAVYTTNDLSIAPTLEVRGDNHPPNSGVDVISYKEYIFAISFPNSVATRSPMIWTKDGLNFQTGTFLISSTSNFGSAFTILKDRVVMFSSTASYTSPSME